jgi:DNA repair exonuclease SbcCD ATPase subunit
MRLDQVPLAEQPTSLLLAACESDATLTATLCGEERIEHGRDAAQPGTEPVGAYLRSIVVAGFRGVGPAARLALELGPGLTVIVGRNGSGKSSFADGLEVLLTGNLRRWQELSSVWRDSWRNLHAPDPVCLSAELVLEEAGPAVAERSWDSGAAFAESYAAVQIHGKKHAELDRLGWREALVTYRPFLSHSELEAFLSGPSHLYDLLSSVLGLEDLAATEKRLAAARKEREDGLKEVNADLPALLERLSSVDDERATACHEALAAKKRSLQRASSIATGAPAVQPDGEIGQLRLLCQLTVPTEQQIKEAATGLRSAADELAEVTGSEAGQALALAKLLSSALQHYHAHGPGSCPVCGRSGALDELWRTQTEQEIARQKAKAARADQAHAQASAAQKTARELFLPIPVVLTGTSVGAADRKHARLAWAGWVKHPDADGQEGLRRLADHIERAWPELSLAVTALASSAGSELRSREDRWAPIARETVAWCSRAQAAEAAAQAVPDLKAAIRWLKGATDDIRNDRLAPLGEQARTIWSRLRQESNVDLGSIRLSGSGPARKVDVKVTVDGSPGTALGVMSQGEVNALALSIFLPRATIAASPFRFLVIDDPVQAMDPAKVDGLARVLEDVSRSRQVLVFTHDDRLPEAVRRLGIAARILEVTRRPGSAVEIRPSLTPVERQLKDAYAMCADDALPPKVAARVIPGLCRLAVEAAFTEAIRRTQLRAGQRHAQVEAAIEAADTLNKKAALAMSGDAAKGGDVLSRLNGWRRAAADTYKTLNRGAHNEHNGSLQSLVSEARVLTRLIREKLP